MNSQMWTMLSMLLWKIKANDFSALWYIKNEFTTKKKQRNIIHRNENIKNFLRSQQLIMSTEIGFVRSFFEITLLFSWHINWCVVKNKIEILMFNRYMQFIWLVFTKYRSTNIKEKTQKTKSKNTTRKKSRAKSFYC